MSDLTAGPVASPLGASTAPDSSASASATPARKTVPITCANVNHNVGPRRNHPKWGEQLGTVELGVNQSDALAATTYICEACASTWRPKLAAWQAQADAHALDSTKPNPGDPPSPVFA